MTMSLYQTVTVGSGGAADIQFANIAQTGKDLLITISARGTYASSTIPVSMQINGDTGTNYPKKNLRGTQSQVVSFGSTGNAIEVGYHGAASGTSNTFGSSQVYIANYALSGTKSVSVDNGVSNNSITQFDWFSFLNAAGTTFTGAVTSLKFYSNYADNFAQHTTISIYIINS